MLAPEELLDHTHSAKDALILAAEELIKHFHKQFHGDDNHVPQSKELGQAVSLVASHGIDQARYIVDFSWKAAGETNYKPQTFGGILQYTSRAAAQYEHSRLAKERLQHQHAEEEARIHLDQAYDAYIKASIDEYVSDPAHRVEIDHLMAEHLTDIASQFPTWGSELRESMARRSMYSKIKPLLGVQSFEEFTANHQISKVEDKAEIQVSSSHEHHAAEAVETNL